ncbi:uncharacterized protein AMSG_00932 [Thecamonas trahens ATCC 50062]|uniref:Oxidoreductase-like domain-containing protein n=1 Tax=Thecamonas trahens ATCC 50062 TaxID=461836 RepID=A0A0L0DIT3_THETB|nr:hypothetical protein AMSG_00932 [Thecamonas trahens ATCC 50062]KNC52105.1 hypothetical protein AMSG_00932 [Thecamonas trahens ATCC 50062]|eukprot:XP_013762109.1 hypothetical protein AMSG_00932 [Thecamonas trahens ATCC 50062]
MLRVGVGRRLVQAARGVKWSAMRAVSGSGVAGGGDGGDGGDGGHDVDVLLPPSEPLNCCGSGCVDCVWIEYFKELNEYQVEMAARAESAAAAKASDALDGSDRSTGAEADAVDAQQVASMSAFAQLEAQLAAKRGAGGG